MLNRRAFLGASTGAAVCSLAAHGQIKPPKPAPELVISLNSGEQILLSKYRGKVVAIEFLLTTCVHCQRASSILNKLQAELGGESAFVALGAATNPDDMTQARMLIPQYVYSLGLKFPVGWTRREMAYQWLELDPNKGPIYFPQLVFVDRKGVIRGYHPGTETEFFNNEEANVRKALEALIKEGSAGPARKAP